MSIEVNGKEKLIIEEALSLSWMEKMAKNDEEAVEIEKVWHKVHESE